MQTFPAKVQLQLIIFFIVIARYWYYCISPRKCVGKQVCLFLVFFFQWTNKYVIYPPLLSRLLNSDTHG